MTTTALVLERVRTRPGSKASEIADDLGISRKAVNSALHGPLKPKVRQDRRYRWYPLDGEQGTGVTAPETRENQFADTELARLCRYYLECLACDDEAGASVFAETRHGDPDYVEVRVLPFAVDGGNPLHEESALALYRRTQRERGRLNAFLGYPTRVRSHRAKSGWEGFFVEPIFLFRIEADENDPNAAPRIADELPTFNLKALRFLTDGNVLEEAGALNEELGLDNPLEEAPDVDEVIARLRAIQPEWDWQEEIDTQLLTSDPPLKAIDDQGIYNRAVVLCAERQLYTQGLETELRKLARLKEHEYRDTALGAWLDGRTDPDETDSTAERNRVLLEALPLNSEQRVAVRKALSSSLSVVTGPPGTGKSQVVTSLLINAAWSRRRVLFASKNNKAVDVVEARVNAFGQRPILLRLGARDYQERLADYLLNLLAATCTEDDEEQFQSQFEAQQVIAKQFEALEEATEKLIELRNHVDRLDRKVSTFRDAWGQDVFLKVREIDLEKAQVACQQLEQAVNRCDRARQGLITRLFWARQQNRRVAQFEKQGRVVRPTARQLGLTFPKAKLILDHLDDWREAVSNMNKRIEEAGHVQEYAGALDELLEASTLEDLSARQLELTEELSEISEAVWRLWVNLQPSRLSREERRLLNDYASVLQMIVKSGQGGQRASKQVFRRYYQLFPKITKLLSCWAVTSLSANNRVPFAPCFFDLLIIDEASQCDIASALPLLYRAKSAVIIGDPKQLRHISAIPVERDQRLQEKYNLLESFPAWAYSVNSLFSLASGQCAPGEITMLRDHHRSHADIIEFSNRFFYEGQLRVATPYAALNRPNPNEPAVRWSHVPGKARRPPTGGAVNETEAKAVLKVLERLVLEQDYEGSVGAVTPFRAQANRVRELVNQNDPLAEALYSREFIVDTVHRFQGDERDVMIFSPVVADGLGAGAVSFLRANGNLFNVAITRARGLLHVVGDQSAALSSGIDYLKAFAEHVRAIGRAEEKQTQEIKSDFGPRYPKVTHPDRVSEWEKVLYRALYKAGVRPIPQYDVEQYTLDFAVFEESARLNIEVDGERYHKDWTGDLCRRDRIRNQRLIELGWDVMRFWVYEVRDELELCVESVKDWCDEARRTQDDLDDE